MKRFVFLALFLLPTAGLWAVQNPNVSSPVGSPTTVPSSTRSGLIPNRPYDFTNRSNVVTGNVGGMKHFRGVVPYGSGYYSSSGQYNSVDDFVRRSDNPILYDRSPGQYRPYYDPRRTVTSASRGGVSGLTPPIITSQGQSNPYAPPSLPQTLNTQYSRQRPLSLSNSELERIIAKQMMLREELSDRHETEDTKDTTTEKPKTDSIFFQDYLRRQDLKTDKDTEQKAEEPNPQPNPVEEALNAAREETAKLLLNELQEKPKAAKPADTADDASKELPAKTPIIGKRTVEQEQAAALLSRYGSFERLAEARVSEYLAIAEEYLKKGNFYKAADSFALATVWKPKDARALAGQAFSLFAAGEYMSSAYYLSRAITEDSNVASQKVDLTGLIGDRDVFENRLIEIKTWQERSGSGELAFLMAFILYHDGKADIANQAINYAAQKMPEDKAVTILKQVLLPSSAN